jgi:hypothetical protein
VSGKGKVRWLSNPEGHDFQAAHDYLSLCYSTDVVRVLMERLANAGIEYRKAKDLLRASDLEALPEDSEHVARDLEKIKAGKALSPILAVVVGGKLSIADGYHRVSACYHIDENTEVAVLLA